jgi:hypothetical protein
MPSRRSIRIVSLTAAVLICGCLAYVVSNRWTHEATFQGRSASYWLREIVRPQTIGSQVVRPRFVGSQILFPQSVGTQFGSSNWFWGPAPAQISEAFNQMGTNAEPALVAAIKAREDPLTGAFRRIYPRLPAAIRKLLPQPYDPLELRAAALFVSRGPVRIHLIPTLLPLLKKPDSALRLAVLSLVVQADAGQIPFLLLASDDPDAKVRREVLRCLSQSGHSVNSAEPAVLKFCSDSDLDVRQDAAWALWKITGQTNTAVPVLENVLSQGAGPNDWTVYHLLLLGDSSPFLVTTLINSLTNRQAGERANVCSFLRDLGPPGIAAVPALRKALQDPEPEVRRRAEVALSKIDPEHAANPAP